MCEKKINFQFIKFAVPYYKNKNVKFSKFQFCWEGGGKESRRSATGKHSFGCERNSARNFRDRKTYVALPCDYPVGGMKKKIGSNPIIGIKTSVPARARDNRIAATSCTKSYEKYGVKG